MHGITLSSSYAYAARRRQEARDEILAIMRESTFPMTMRRVADILNRSGFPTLRNAEKWTGALVDYAFRCGVEAGTKARQEQQHQLAA